MSRVWFEHGSHKKQPEDKIKVIELTDVVNVFSVTSPKFFFCSWSGEVIGICSFWTFPLVICESKLGWNYLLRIYEFLHLKTELIAFDSGLWMFNNPNKAVLLLIRLSLKHSLFHLSYICCKIYTTKPLRTFSLKNISSKFIYLISRFTSFSLLRFLNRLQLRLRS